MHPREPGATEHEHVLAGRRLQPAAVVGAKCSCEGTSVAAEACRQTGAHGRAVCLLQLQHINKQNKGRINKRPTCFTMSSSAQNVIPNMLWRVGDEMIRRISVSVPQGSISLQSPNLHPFESFAFPRQLSRMKKTQT